MNRPLVLLVLALLVTPAGAAEWGSRGISRAFVVRGTTLYAADGRGVSAWDVTDPRTPVLRQVEAGDSETRELAFMGEGDLVVATTGGLDRFAVAADGALTRLDPLSRAGGFAEVVAGEELAAGIAGRELTLVERDGSGLKVRRTMRFGHPIAAAVFVDGLLYVSVELEGTTVFDPPSTTPLKNLATTPVSFARAGDVLWAAGPEAGFRRIDVSNPRNPAITGKTDPAGIHPFEVRVSGSLIAAMEPPGMVHLFRLDGGGLPELQATLHEPVSVLALDGPTLFLAGAPLDPDGVRIEDGRPLRAFDASNPASPQPLGSVSGLAGPVSGVWTDGTVAYVVDRPWLRVLDVSRTAEPREIASVIVPELQDQIRVRDGLAVIYGGRFVNFVDVSNPRDPRPAGTWATEGHAPSVAAFADGRVVEGNMHSGMHVLDVSDPADPLLVGWRKWHYSDLAAGRDAVYAIQDWGLLVLELAGRTSLVERGRIGLAEASQVETIPPGSSDPRQLLVRDRETIRLFELADRFAPQQAAAIAVPGARLAGATEREAWIAAGGRLHRVALDGPLTPEPTDMRVVAPMQISVAGSKIVVADRYSVRVFGPDTTSPVPDRRRAVRH